MFDPATLLLLLLAGHALCDYSLQGEFLAETKRRTHPVGRCNGTWVHSLTAHALIHGGMVTLLTGSAALGIFEIIIHWMVDAAKCERMINLHTDQAIHVACKLAWWAIAVWWLV